MPDAKQHLLGTNKNRFPVSFFPLNHHFYFVFFTSETDLSSVLIGILFSLVPCPGLVVLEERLEGSVVHKLCPVRLCE